MSANNDLVSTLVENLRISENKNKNLKEMIEKVKKRREELKNEIENLKLEKENKSIDNEKSSTANLPLIRTKSCELIERLENILNSEKEVLNLGLTKTESSKQRIYETLKEIKLRFTSQEKYNKMYIMGDFTNWEPILMQKKKDAFIYTTVLLKNYKYYYCYQSDGHIILDNTNYLEENPNNCQINNVINLNKENSENIFNCRDNYKYLQEERTKYFNISLDSSDVTILKNTISCSNKVKEYIAELVQLKEEEKKNAKDFFESKSIRSQIANPNQSSKDNEISLFNKVSNIFKGRILIFRGLQYYVHSFDFESSNIHTICLYDKNNIRVNIDFYISKSLLIKIPMKEFLSENTVKNIIVYKENKVQKQMFNKDIYKSEEDSNDYDKNNESDEPNLFDVDENVTINNPFPSVYETFHSKKNQNIILDSEQSKVIMTKYNENKNILRITYRVRESFELNNNFINNFAAIKSSSIGGIMSSNFGFFENKYYSGMNQLEIISIHHVIKENDIEVEEKQMPIADYKIEQGDKSIYDVKSTELNVKIYYELKEIKAEAKKKSLKIWTAIKNKSLSIIHYHLLNKDFMIPVGANENSSNINIDISSPDHQDIKLININNLKKEDQEIDLAKAMINYYNSSKDSLKNLIITISRLLKITSVCHISKENIITFINNLEGKSISTEKFLGFIDSNDTLILKDIMACLPNINFLNFDEEKIIEKKFVKSLNCLESQLINNIFEVQEINIYSDDNINMNIDIEDHDLLDFCHECSLCGSLKLKLILDSKLKAVKDNLTIKLPICKVESLPITLESKYLEIYNKAKSLSESDEINTLEYLNNWCKNVNLDKISNEDRKFVECNEPRIVVVSSYLEKNELWNELEKLSYIMSIFEAVKASKI